MGDKLLIRAYNVGCGDCFYIRIPGGNDGFHILVDCGKKGGTELLQKAVRHIEENLLPPGKRTGKKRLDLIVAKNIGTKTTSRDLTPSGSKTLRSRMSG